ncbi:putative 2OG-Fe(II) oxygenase [Rheinheimera sp.]|uniref:putative 2OG-Fe(II) oxygenase n=1 Tax=Rheinheimera sp. TaxID=1869214 RepID=UPI003AF71287
MALEPQILPMFATPFVVVSFPDPERMNAGLSEFFDLLTSQGNQYRNKHPHNYVQDELFESNFDLFKFDQPDVQALRNFILQSIGWVITKLNGYSREQMDKIQLFADAWFHITEFGGYFYTHNHPMASWSAVYCVDPGDDVEGKPDSGVLRFHDPRPHCNAYLDGGNAGLNGVYNTSNFNFKLQPGQLVIFPSYLQHEVAPFFGKKRRITVAVNCWTNRYGG